MAFRIIGTLHNLESGKFPADGQQLVNHQNLRQAQGESVTVGWVTSCTVTLIANPPFCDMSHMSLGSSL